MKNTIIWIILAATMLTASCGGSDADLTPTVDPMQIQTEAVQTFSAQLTQNAPTQTPFQTPTASATFAPLPTLGSTLSAPTQQGSAPTASCYQLLFVSDVTIPDNTPMTPGQTFTKTWRVRNTGSCAWDAGFKFSFVGGEPMNGTTYTLPASVAANAETDISVAMTAPTNKTGTLRGDWRMATAGGQFFGQQIYVQIVIGGSSTGTPTATPTATATP